MHACTSFQARTLSGIAILLFTILPVRGATYLAATAKVPDIQSKIDLARDGDTIVVPPGTARWTTPLTIKKNIILRGAGIGQTVILDEVPRTPGSHSLSVDLSKDLPFRLTGFEIRGSANVTARNEDGVVQFRGMTGVGHQFRVDHCKFTALYGLALRFRELIGVVDHCELEAQNDTLIQVFHTTWGGEDFAHGSWADDPYWGSDKFLFFEDCTFSNTNFLRAGLDCYEGARIVVRHNTFSDAQVTAHGTESRGRGTKQLEIYNNQFKTSTARAAAQLRSGTVLVHDNVYNNFTSGMSLMAYRQIVPRGTWGISSGSNVWDVNNPVLAPFERGTHTGASSATTLVDSNKNWTANEWETVVSRKGFTYVLRNITQNLQSYITSNTQKTISYFQYTPTMTFNNGDMYEVWKVVTTLDQPGQGKSNLLYGKPALPKGWPHNVLEPCYSWNNKDEQGKQLDLHSGEGSIKEGRDYFNRTYRPNYAPYRYPHPLTLAN